MSKILSQNEVNMLLKGVEGGEIETGMGKADEFTLKPYDFMSQKHIFSGRMHGLEMVSEKFSREFRNAISLSVMNTVEAALNDIKVMQYSEFLKTISFPSSISSFSMDPLKGEALLIMDTRLIFAFIELFFGASSVRNVKAEGRFFTSIEQRLIYKVVNIALNTLETAWESVIPLKLEHTGHEMNAQYFKIVMPTETVIRVEFIIQAGGFEDKMVLCFPSLMMEPIKNKIINGKKQEGREDDQVWRSGITRLLVGSEVNMAVEIGKVNLSIGDIMGLQQGNVLVLGQALSEELEVKVEGTPKFKGMIGLSNGSQAVKITRLISQERENK
jgi:flagellar motor switch protein FliM